MQNNRSVDLRKNVRMQDIGGFLKHSVEVFCSTCRDFEWTDELSILEHFSTSLYLQVSNTLYQDRNDLRHEAGY